MPDIHSCWNRGPLQVEDKYPGYTGEDVYACRAPSCNFIGSLEDSVKHIIENQFIVVEKPVSHQKH